VYSLRIRWPFWPTELGRVESPFLPSGTPSGSPSITITKALNDEGLVLKKDGPTGFSVESNRIGTGALIKIANHPISSPLMVAFSRCYIFTRLCDLQARP